ncbi:hypothetical protein O6H91_07G054600 [Diphasiastrum complanatum]|uniref:Uncharacterized protein n=3 Tax=Diphasiastrum complanatum TaxID=34168 RepID=A0ACC2D5B6_DIPCM|nr:hypothetical protein O6H91_07G054600 [Diphasiastrum complanatum]KAJ7549472.1 hypothetical protein O6H91_07G054600 [Diphasiastrum complanatum]KAJ7549473.1 hypothetical protein O6H91_07G054600 [Diphasiastrum complanatum]
MTDIKEARSSEDHSIEGGSIREGAWHWVRVQDNEGRPSTGVVVMAAWMLSKRKYQTPYISLYNSLGWDCLICDSHVLNLWFPSRATSLARKILDELVEELQHRQRPIVFASFSGGVKACLYKLFQIIQGKSENGSLIQKYEMVGACAAGQIFDSCPIDFQSSIGVKFVKAQLQSSLVPKVVVDILVGGANTVLEPLFHSNFEEQRLDAWRTLHASWEMGPILVLCSKKDELAPFDRILEFCSDMRNFGCEVTLMSWEDSDHVGHYRLHPLEYKTAVSNLLASAYVHYLQRIKDSVSSHESASILSSASGISNSYRPISGLSKTRVGMQTNDAIEKDTFSAETDVTGKKLHGSPSYQSFSSTSSSQANMPSEQSDEIDDIPCGENELLGWNAANQLSKRSRL